MSIAIIRDMYSGDYMARIMSFVTVVFILVPVIAPAMGKFILDYYNWHGIFYIQVLISILVSWWFGNDNQRLYLLITRKNQKRFYRRI
jgi:DHA1 family bicyclomycin/chloramphenicol resistance-like MFS transporter